MGNQTANLQIRKPTLEKMSDTLTTLPQRTPPEMLLIIHSSLILDVLIMSPHALDVARM